MLTSYRTQEIELAPLYSNGGLLVVENPFNTKNITSAYKERPHVAHASRESEKERLVDAFTQDDLADYSIIFTDLSPLIKSRPSEVEEDQLISA